MNSRDCCILNSGGGSWAFGVLATELSDAQWVDVSETPRAFNYLLLADDAMAAACERLFIPLASVRIAADKRLVAEVFAKGNVPTPRTHLVESLDEASDFSMSNPTRNGV